MLRENGGNITSRDTNGVVDTWEYNDSNWKDLLTAYNGMPITYDEIGNPLTYRDGINMTWENGRRLASLTKGSDSISYTYNADGIRTSKTVNGQTTEYVVDGSTILGEKLPNGGEIYYFFDENGVRYGFARGGNLYYYAYNGQGDVIEIYTSGGRLEAWYEYDSWGKVTEMGGNLAVAEMNPIRYRGYYYDTETGFYYLNSRYYDPETCRFINADGYVSTGQGLLSGNMFAYCLNNPVSNEDSSGSIPMRVKYSSDGGGYAKNMSLFGGSKSAEYKTVLEKTTIGTNLMLEYGVVETVVVKHQGDDSRPISGYIKERIDDGWLSSIGAKINVGLMPETINLSLDDISYKKSLFIDDTEYSLAVKINLLDLRVCLESSKTKMWDENLYTTKYSEYGVDLSGVATATLLLVAPYMVPMFSTALVPA